MSIEATALNVDSVDRFADAAASPSGVQASARERSRLHRFIGVLGALVVAPLVVLGLTALVLRFLAALLGELAATGFER